MASLNIQQLKQRIEARGYRFEEVTDIVLKVYHSKTGQKKNRAVTASTYFVKESSGRVVYSSLEAMDIDRWYLRNLAGLDEKREHYSSLTR